MKKIKMKLYPNEIGVSDCVATYCCSSIPCFYVGYGIGTDDEYWGYFEVKDCEIQS